MKQLSVILLGIVLLSGTAHAAGETAARDAANREAAEERYRILQSTVDDLLAAQRETQRRLDAVEEAVRRLGIETRSKPAEDKVVTRKEYEALLQTVRDLNTKREADRRQVLEQIEELGRTLTESLKELKPGPSPRVSSTETRGGGGASTQVGAKHMVERGQTLSAIIVAYNAEWKGRGRRTSLQLILDANPGLEPTTMPAGKEIFIPMVPINP